MAKKKPVAQYNVPVLQYYRRQLVALSQLNPARMAAAVMKDLGVDEAMLQEILRQPGKPLPDPFSTAVVNSLRDLQHIQNALTPLEAQMLLRLRGMTDGADG